MSALRNVRILDLSERPAGEYCARLLADFGASVMKVERPGGSPTRDMAPRLGEHDTSALFAYLNAGKHSIELDLDSASGRDELHALLANADILVDDHDRDWLVDQGLCADDLAARHPNLVACSITPYGLDCPAEWLPADSLNVFHRSGWGYHTPGTAKPGQAPLPAAGRFLCDYEAALDAALCIVAAWVSRLDSGDGEFIDVAEHAVMVSRADTVLGRNLAGEEPASDARSAFEMGGPAASFRCRDGFLFLFMTTAQHWRALASLMDDPHWMREFPEDWLEYGITDARVETFRRHFATWVAERDKETVYLAGQKLGIPFAPLYHASDVYASAQLAHRGYFQALDDPQLGRARYPTQPARFSATPAHLRAPAPELAAHAGIAAVWKQTPPEQVPHDSREKVASKPGPNRGGPLSGVRVLELTKVWAGPYTGKLLALLGADVIKVESESKLDEMRAYGGTDINNAPYFLCLNPEVRSVQVNMKTPEGLEQLRALVAQSDIVLDNLRPGVMAGMGLDFAGLSQTRPDIVAVSIKMFGNDGPLGLQTGFAPSFAALGGLSLQVGYEGEPPTGMNMRYGDSTVGAWAAFAAVVGLAHARRSGEGQFVDVSAVECLATMIGDNLLAYDLTGDFAVSAGNRHPQMAPYGCYPCRESQWLSLAVSDDASFAALCGVLGAQDLAQDARFATLPDRQQHRAELDQAIASCTSTQDAETLAGDLRRAGVPAARSLSTRDMVQDDWLWQRGTYLPVQHADGRQRPVIAAPWQLARNPARNSHGAPDLGQHTAEVFSELLGMSRETLAELEQAGVLR
ncbi:CoA transferase [Mangrovimicrobium sediminis]|uniref:CoA transferase n=1 Tax=Mangrovimicrobium sediminis TaxID=2562682 RepID=A0A4Z0M395_9GAMM|nr:CoA transferase [Haliea sp. SAOS-164]TGD73917.1 CoA transferase [Haliea sp. SAOS-164]